MLRMLYRKEMLTYSRIKGLPKLHPSPQSERHFLLKKSNMYVCLWAQLVSSEKAFKGSHHRNSQEALQLVVAQHQSRIS